MSGAFVFPTAERFRSRILFQPRRGDTREPRPSRPVAPIGAGNGEGQGSLGHVLGLTPPGYELLPLLGWGVPRDLQSVNPPLWAACGRCEGKPL